MEVVKKKFRLSSFQIILVGFASVILLGALLLMLPISSNSGVVTPFIDALFTSTSAVCVTGLVIYDTATYWSIFGQIVILLLIQIGGLGVITVALSLIMLSGKKIGLMQRGTMQEAISAPSLGGIMRRTGFIIRSVFIIEIVGALCMMPVFCIDYGGIGVYYAFFHSISAFCNAGFDILGTTTDQFVSLTQYVGQPVINIVVMLLIIIGGLGFITWEDICTHKWRVHKYRLQSKVILITTGCLILFPAIYLFFFEFADMPFGQRLLASLFQSVTPRTAGFNTVDLTHVSQTALTLIITLMIIGGSPGSTAGGMKTTTFAVVLVSMFSVFRKKDNTVMLGRTVSDDIVKQAFAIMVTYITLFLLGAMVISRVENLPILTCLFETGSAIGTVGLTIKDPAIILSVVSKLILILLMFFGRVGALTLIYATLAKNQKTLSKFPVEKISIG